MAQRIGRSYEEVGLYLPPVTETVIKGDFDTELRNVYNQLKRNYRFILNGHEDITIDSAAEVLQALRQVTVCAEKLNMLDDIVQSIRRSNAANVPVIFCWYRETARIVGDFIQGKVITGDIAPADRFAMAKDSDVPIVCTMASMSEGVDLSFARYVIFFEEDYTPGRMYQAISRVRRLTGDTDDDTRREPVFVYYLQMRKSVDEAIHTVIERRQSGIKAVLNEALRN